MSVHLTPNLFELGEEAWDTDFASKIKEQPRTTSEECPPDLPGSRQVAVQHQDSVPSEHAKEEIPVH